MDFTLEVPTEAQADQVCAIWDAGWHEAHAEIVPSALRDLRTTESFLDRTRENLASTRVAVEGATVLGLCMIKEDELYQMYVSHRARGSGVARALIQDAEKRIGLIGYNTAWLACAIGNERARRFYERSGWSNTGQHLVDLDTSDGAFSLEVWRFEKKLNAGLLG